MVNDAAWRAAVTKENTVFFLLLQTFQPDYQLTSVLAKQACMAGSLECLKLLHEQGCPVTKGCVRPAAKGGNIKCLEFLSMLGIPYLLTTTFASAAKAGHWELMLKLMRSGVVCDDSVYEAAVEAPTINCLEHLLTQCKCQSSKRQRAALKQKMALLPCAVCKDRMKLWKAGEARREKQKREQKHQEEIEKLQGCFGALKKTVELLAEKRTDTDDPVILALLKVHDTFA